MPPTASQGVGRSPNPFPRLGVALGFILLLDGAYLLGGPLVRASLDRWGIVWSALFLALPLADVAAGRGSLASLGYQRAGWLRWTLWGVLAGAVWRLVDVLTLYPLWGPGLGLGPFIAWGCLAHPRPGPGSPPGGNLLPGLPPGWAGLLRAVVGRHRRPGCPLRLPSLAPSPRVDPLAFHLPVRGADRVAAVADRLAGGAVGRARHGQRPPGTPAAGRQGPGPRLAWALGMRAKSSRPSAKRGNEPTNGP